MAKKKNKNTKNFSQVVPGDELEDAIDLYIATLKEMKKDVAKARELSVDDMLDTWAHSSFVKAGRFLKSSSNGMKKTLNDLLFGDNA